MSLRPIPFVPQDDNSWGRQGCQLLQVTEVIPTAASYAVCLLQSFVSTAAVENLAIACRREQHLRRMRHRADLGRSRTPLRFLAGRKLERDDTPTQSAI